jgi:anti-sigma factor RsiW
MPTCEHCQTTLLDYLYGLLDENETQEVREHLDVCPSCQASLEKAQGHQKLLARAARPAGVA